ncbi:MAG: threonine--tRNA ligase [Candidatus Komeilibacteria bacterium CG11_big_fil_rev_8_21_14_0_20_36_20]|uniref:Threonine--tRNA ligase n=1 Tax=Candidatus Komeilibacteria bacterium CG11_big_fil_rev_8_21_14_0_20_36_20 TaxID=1974477 RepID=A0A2H0ND03_9BACT|nr:MAG: threonine--tRNA ligase [Candidatus Komeilibacteria bacterium CG11_big_fil_rev_8_21_14_0_20_36_20]PIR82046.1 MAG: threonine--tRNA ligase [Candidatus Komeilibacteria bacterium CG10_big_fil_rev_8_21_14_0_10_36_65]PJC55025.1 MAG: threonine--tRNA ligase [Candidatus Komeilibacteria bacterium CG_4_9_14_0_2_um_filter_36_13]
MPENKINNIRHSLSHLLAMVVLKKFPQAKLGIGPTITNGFYYDFLLPQKIAAEDLLSLEKEMKKLIKQKIDFKKTALPRSQALEKVKKEKQNFKIELIDDLPDGEEISFYESGDFSDLCRGPHVENTSEINPDAFKLTDLAGAYWRGSEKNQMLTRIYGVAFTTEKELTAHLKMMEEAKKRDHRQLGKEMDLFSFSELVGSGLPLWTPKGTIIRQELDDFVWQLRKKYNYQKVSIPHITKKDLYQVSGHWEKFKDELFKIKTRENHELAIKPMNCPHHTQIYAHLPRSYRDLPQRYAETTMVYRDEQTGELAGLSRVRCITQDDAHAFCRYSQVKEEMIKIIAIVNSFYQPFDFDLKVRLSLHDPKDFDKYIGQPKTWQKMEKQLKELLQEQKIKHEEALGEAAMYGPKIDFMANDSLGREWQLATIQLDYNMPERFQLACTNEKGQEEPVAMLHAAITGSIERFISILIEHLAGNFPVWLAPIQIKILTVSENHTKFAEELKQEFEQYNLRVEIDNSAETLGNKIRKNSREKIPYTLVIGDKEMSSKNLAVRVRDQKQLLNLSRKDFINQITKNINERKLNLI